MHGFNSELGDRTDVRQGFRQYLRLSFASLPPRSVPEAAVLRQVALCFITLAFSSVGMAQESPRAIAFTGVTVIDVARGVPVGGQTVVIQGNRIVDVGG